MKRDAKLQFKFGRAIVLSFTRHYAVSFFLDMTNCWNWEACTQTCGCSSKPRRKRVFPANLALTVSRNRKTKTRRSEAANVTAVVLRCKYFVFAFEADITRCPGIKTPGQNPPITKLQTTANPKSKSSNIKVQMSYVLVTVTGGFTALNSTAAVWPTVVKRNRDGRRPLGDLARGGLQFRFF